MKKIEGVITAGILAMAAFSGCEKPAPPPTPPPTRSSNLAPEGVFFLKVAAQGKLAGKVVTKPPGSLLHKVGENSYQTPEGAIMNLTADFVTDDMRVVRLIEDENRRIAASTTPTPPPPPPPPPPAAPMATPPPPSTPRYESPLSKGAYDSRANWRRSYATPVPMYR